MSERSLSRFERRQMLPGWSVGCALLLMLTVACEGKDAAAPGADVTHVARDQIPGSYQLIGSPEMNIAQISNAHVIGREGGRLSVGLDELIVPPGAVNRPTVFRMRRQMGAHVVVDLDAFDRQTGAVVDTFEKPLELKLSYRFTRVNNPDRLVVLWLRDARSDGELVPMPTVVIRKSKHIVGSLMHFSQYAMGLN